MRGLATRTYRRSAVTAHDAAGRALRYARGSARGLLHHALGHNHLHNVNSALKSRLRPILWDYRLSTFDQNVALFVPRVLAVCQQELTAQQLPSAEQVQAGLVWMMQHTPEIDARRIMDGTEAIVALRKGLISSLYQV